MGNLVGCGWSNAGNFVLPERFHVANARIFGLGFDRTSDLATNELRKEALIFGEI